MSRHSNRAWGSSLGLSLSLGLGLGLGCDPSTSEPTDVAPKGEEPAKPAPQAKPDTKASGPTSKQDPAPALPSEPPPSTEPEPPPSVASAPATGLPGGATPSDTALSEKMKRRLRSKLREQHDVLIELPAALALVEPTGNVAVLGLYEYSEVEACVSKSDGSKEARKACANARTDANDRPLPALRKCTLRGLVRARFGPPPKSNPEYGGALEILATRPFSGGCTITKVRRLELADVDGDGQPELEVDVISKTPESYFIQDEDFDEERGRAETYALFTRTIGWYRSDLSPQYQADLTSWHTELIEAVTDGTSIRVRLTDANGDGRADLFFDTVRYDAAECQFEDDGWLVMGSDPDEGCAGDVTTTVWPYDPAKDQWVQPIEIPAPTD